MEIVANPHQPVLRGSTTIPSNSQSPSATALPSLSLPEAAEEFHTSLVSCYSHLAYLAQQVEATTPSVNSSKALAQTTSRMKAALVCTRRRGLQALQVAANEWRSLRYAVAYTLINWERVRTYTP